MTTSEFHSSKFQGKTEDTLEEVAELLHLPRDIFTVRDPEDDVHEYTVFTKQRLHQGITFGPYFGHVVHDNEENLHVIQTKDENGENIRFALTDETGGWFKLLKPTPPCEESNATLLHNESAIWCTIQTDIEPDTELLVSHCLANDVTPPDRDFFEPRTHSKHLLRKNKVNRVKCKNVEGSDGFDRSEETSLDRRKNSEEQAASVIKAFSLLQQKSPSHFRENEDVYNSRLSGLKYETPSPAVPPCSSSPPTTNAVPKNGTPQMDSPTDAAIPVPYINGCSYPPAFPYAGLITSSGADGAFKCDACEVSFNTRRTLEVHQSYYCQGKLSGAVASSDTDTEDALNSKSDSIAIGSPDASEDGDNNTTKEPCKIPQPEAFPNEDALVLSKRRRAISLGDVPPGRQPRLLKCPYCNYSSDKKASLTRHVRMHGPSPSAEGLCEVQLATPPMARYCANCDIQFASYKNYQVHKEYYCNTRHVHKSVTSSSSPNLSQQTSQQQSQSLSSQPRSPESTTSQQEAVSKGYNMVLNQPLYAAISTSPLILVPCSYVAGGGLSPAAGLIPAGNIIIPNPAASPDGGSDSQGPNVIPTYTVMPGATQDTANVPSPVSAEDTVKEEPKIINKPVKEKVVKQEPAKSPKDTSKEEAEMPLDLSFRKRDGDSAKPATTKANPEAGSSSANYASTPSSASVGEDNSTSAPSGPSLPILPLMNPTLDMNILSRAQIQGLDQSAPTLTPVLAPPQVLVKQGTSKCKECNIVFYKHENYLVHKNRYCAARLQNTKRETASPERVKPDESESTDREESGRVTQKSPISPQRSTNARTPPAPDSSDSCETSPSVQQAAAMLQYYCMACGIKYTSIDNLRAHQLYYCPKREINTAQPVALVPSFPRNAQEFKCGKCKNAYPTEELLRQHPCVVQRKCPYCDVYCPTLSAAQRHLVTHTGIKSFRCSLCGYKGHTLRGMRTHIRIHLDKNSSTPEEAYILCMDEGGSEIGCASRKSSGVRMNSDRIKSVIATEPPHNETTMAVSPISGPLPNIVASDIVAIKAVPDDPVATGDTTHWCQICGYSSSYKGNVVRHVKLVHKDLVSSQAMSNIVNTRPTIENVMKQSESMDHTSSGTPQEASLATSSTTDHSNSSSSMDVKPIMNGMLPSAEQPVRLEDKPLMLKTERVSPPLSSSSTGSKGIKRPLSEEGQCPSGAFSSKTGPKYCKTCDISFNYLSNFLAHKKFYCTPRPGEVTGQESSSVQSVQ